MFYRQIRSSHTNVITSRQRAGREIALKKVKPGGATVITASE